jgi:GNAT superfamily N-acetyltransferase
VLRAYFRDIVSRYYGREAADGEVTAAMREEPSDDLSPPRGLFLVARAGGAVVGCGGVRFLPGGTGEIRRVFVMPPARGCGVGTQLLDALETAARDHQVSRLRLDTHGSFTEARRLYARRGYREAAPFSNGPFAEYWYEKILA